MEDAKIIELLCERSEQAIAALSEKYGALCLKIALNVLNSREDAEECVNDAYLGVWNTVPPQKPDPLVSYVCRIVRNLAVKKYRYNTAQKRNSFYDAALDELAECFPSPQTVESELEAEEITRALDGFLETLDKKSRVMFVRRYWYSESPEELSALFGISGHAVSVRLDRIKKKLKKYLAEKGVLP